MGLFITVNIDAAHCAGLDACGRCVDVCPVAVFEKKDLKPAVVGGNEDECTLCDLCLDVCQPGCIHITKEYAT